MHSLHFTLCRRYMQKQECQILRKAVGHAYATFSELWPTSSSSIMHIKNTQKPT